MSGLPREVVKWIQSLDLTWQMKTPKWDLTNGYLIGEIFSWYYPQEIQMHNFNNGDSLDSKQRNWYILQNFIKRHKLDIPHQLIDGTIHCREGAAPLLTERIYEILTNRRIRKIPPEHDIDFTDRAYQIKLPFHARSTASQAIKNNLKNTELLADKSIVMSQQKAQHIINNHIEYRCIDRFEDPEHFSRQPTLGELAIRQPPRTSAVKENNQDQLDEEPRDEVELADISKPPTRENTDNYREISVKQLGSAGQSRT